jgi:hypothetical protein
VNAEKLSYAVDDQDRLIRVDEGFYRFAEANGWDAVGDTLGRSLWDFVAGHDVSKLQRLLLRRIREGAGPIELPFRCDSPDLRREMDIKIAADRSGRVVLFSASLREAEDWDEPQPLLSASVRRGGDFLPMCAWCDRFLVHGEWVEVEVAAKALELFRRTEMPPLDHSICPACAGTLQAT